MPTKIYSVDDIQLAILKTNPLTLRIIATGLVTSSGWGEPQLSRYVYIAPPVDGIYDFDFLANRPGGTVLQPILPITAAFQWQPFPTELKGVRIHASAGSLEAMLDGPDGIEFKNLQNSGDIQIPMFLTGIVVDVGICYCRDAATHRLLHFSTTGEPTSTRLAANNDEAREVLGKASGSRQRIMVAGYLKHGIEPGCDYLSTYYAGPELSPEGFAEKASN
ncbi:MAG: hypothetical protein ABI073_06825 [Luteolibacter sp.]